MIKKFVCILFIFLLAFPMSAYAENPVSKIQNPSLQNEVEGEYVCDDDLPDDGMISPLVTCTGNGGVARINYLESAALLTWNVDPRFSTIYTFTGLITIINQSTGNIEDTIAVSCSGAFGGQCGYEVSPDTLYSYRPYIATLTGTASDASGLFSWVVPPCSVSFLSY